MERIAKYILFLWMLVVITAAYLWAPLAKVLEEYTRILYFHVPTAWITVIAFLIGASYSVMYLRKKDIKSDMVAEAASQLGFLFCVLATVTGSIWAKVSWGSFWNWDPRETSIFILLLIYAAYFALRSAVEEPERKATLSAVYSILAFVTVPFFVFIVPRIYEGLHPDVIGTAVQAKDKGSVMGPRILVVFLSSLAGFTALFLWMFKSKLDLIKIKISLRDLEK